MATMNISLPDVLKAYVESRVAEGRYSNVSDYVRDLIRKELEKGNAKKWLEAEIEKGYASGFHESTLDEFFQSAATAAKAKPSRKKTA
jgi:antitoxin ParD1/3/4